MNELEKLNRSVNRSLRELNGIAVAVSSSLWTDRKAALHEVIQALAHLDAVQRLIYTSDPKLEYHFDPNRPPTHAMTMLAQLVDKAEDQARNGDVPGAKQALQRALELEPPPLAYETIEKRLNELK